METCWTKCFHRNALFRALNPFHVNLSNPVLRCSSMSRTHMGGRNCVKRAYDALLLDAGGTLLQLVNPVEETYASIGKKYSLTASPAEIKQGFKRVFSAPWPEKLRYQGDGRPFWKLVVSEATGCANDDYFEEVYKYYANGDAWRLPDGAHRGLVLLKDAGVKVAVVSNFDTRLRKLLKDLNVIDLFDALVISSEVGYEKPDPEIFKVALGVACYQSAGPLKMIVSTAVSCQHSRGMTIQLVHCPLFLSGSPNSHRVGVEAANAVHVGDDYKADKEGAIAVGIDCWLWGAEVKSFPDIQNRILIPV